MFALHPYRKSFCLRYVRTAPLPEKFCGAFSKATSCARRRIGIFLFGAFSFCASKGKKKKRCEAKCNSKKHIRISIAMNFYLQIVTLSPLSFFLLVKEAQKKKGPKKKDAERGISLVATSDKGYAPLTCANF